MRPEEVLRRARGSNLLLEDEAKELLEAAGISTVKCYPVHSVGEALSKAEEIGFPVVMKLMARALPHKSDAGGVELDLKNPDAVAEAYGRLEELARDYGEDSHLVLQAMARPGTELIIGVTTDPHFGPVIMLGLGGVFTELLRDTTYRLLPVTREDARSMPQSLRGFRLLQGYRGTEPVDLEALEDILLKVSDLVTAYPEISEMDLNPVVAYGQGALVLDARLVLKDKD